MVQAEDAHVKRLCSAGLKLHLRSRQHDEVDDRPWYQDLGRAGRCSQHSYKRSLGSWGIAATSLTRSVGIRHMVGWQYCFTTIPPSIL